MMLVKSLQRQGLTYQQPLTAAQNQRLGTTWLRAFRAWDWLVDPVFLGFEHVPNTGPLLWVGNHSLMGMADAPLMLREIYKQKGFVLRSLGLHAHFRIPLWGELLVSNGVVDGTRPNCAAMMQAGEHILVYPGGGGEVMKRKGEQYALRWKARSGFARMAIENNTPILPFATIGADECWDIMLDNNYLRQTKLGRWLINKWQFKPEEIPPIVKGLGPTLLPKPQRMYFKFLAPINPADFAHLPHEEAILALRQATHEAITQGITELMALRESDPKRSLYARLRSRLS